MVDQIRTPPDESLLTKVAVSFDGKLTIAADYQGRIVIWDRQKAEMLGELSVRLRKAVPGCFEK